MKNLSKDEVESVFNGDVKDLAKKLGININKAYLLCYEYGLKTPNNKKKEMLEKLAEECKDINELCEKLKFSPNGVYLAFKRHGLKVPKTSKLNHKIPATKADLEALYINHNMEEIAKIYGVSRQAVHNWIKNYGIKTRSVGSRHKVYAILFSKEELEKEYDLVCTLKGVADKFQVSSKHMRFMFKHYGIPLKRGPMSSLNDEELKRDFYKLSYKEMSVKYGVKLLSVFRKAKRMGLSKKKSYPLTKDYCERNRYRTNKEIAEELGCSVVTVSVNMRKHLGQKRRYIEIPDADIKAYLENKISLKALSEKYGFSIYGICTYIGKRKNEIH